MPPYIHPTVRPLVGTKETGCQYRVIDVWVITHPVHANFAQQNATFVKKLDILLKLADQRKTEIYKATKALKQNPSLSRKRRNDRGT